MKWEYTCQIRRLASLEDAREMQKMGQAGWELVSVTEQGEGFSIVDTLWFKRPIE